MIYSTALKLAKISVWTISFRIKYLYGAFLLSELLTHFYSEYKAPSKHNYREGSLWWQYYTVLVYKMLIMSIICQFSEL